LKFTFQHTLPSGPKLTLYDFKNDTYTRKRAVSEAGSGGDCVANARAFYSAKGHGYHFDSRKDDRLYVANFNFLGLPYHTDVPYGDNSSTLEVIVSKYQIQATECALWLCVKGLTASVESNVLLQTSTTSAQMPPRVNGTSNYIFPSIGVSGGNKTPDYFVLHAGLQGLIDTLHGSLSATVEKADGYATYSSNLMQGLWNGSTDPDAWIEDLATSLTNVMRKTNSSQRAEYEGTAYQLGVTVRWHWTVLPAALVELSIVLLIAVVIRTAQSPVQAWKGSPLTLVFLEADLEIARAGTEKANTHHGFEKAVGKARVRLQELSNGRWKMEAA
jgi:hypothetical protein